MKTHFFNTNEIKLLGFSRVQMERAETIFIEFATEFGMTLIPVYKPSMRADMKLVGGDEEDFTQLLLLVKESL